MKSLGIIGGLGPMTTAYLYKLIIEMTEVTCDQDHIKIIIYNNPEVPDRTSYILDNRNDNPVNDLIEMGLALQNLSTSGTLESQLFQKLSVEYNVELVLPNKKYQEYIMNIIYEDIKAGREINYKKFKRVTNYLTNKGAERIILGCTELSLINIGKNPNNIYVDLLEILARKIVALCGGKLKENVQKDGRQCKRMY